MKRELTYSVHPAGICEASAVGARTRIWAFAHVLPGAVIGSDCNICDHVFIENDVVVGDVDPPRPGERLEREVGSLVELAREPADDA